MGFDDICWDFIGYMILILTLTAILWLVVFMMVYDPHYSPKSTACTSLQYVEGKGFFTDEGYVLYASDEELKQYLKEHQNTPLQLTIRNGIFHDYIVGERGFVEKYPVDKRIPDGYTGNCTGGI
jgi:hypothetical protein